MCFFSFGKLFLKFRCPRVDNMCHTHTHTQQRQSMPARLKLSLVSFGKLLLRQPLLPDTFHTKQWMSSGEHWVFIRRTHVRWIYDEFSTRWHYIRGATLFFQFGFSPKFLLSFPACFLWHFRRLYEAWKIVTVFNRKMYATRKKNFFNEPHDNVCLIVLCSKKKNLELIQYLWIGR